MNWSFDIKWPPRVNLNVGSFLKFKLSFAKSNLNALISEIGGTVLPNLLNRLQITDATMILSNIQQNITLPNPYTLIDDIITIPNGTFFCIDFAFLDDSWKYVVSQTR